MVTLSSVEAILIAAAPAITAIIGIIAGIVRLIKSFKSSNKELVNELVGIKDQIVDREQYENLKNELALVHQENRELKKKLNELLTHFDNIYRPVEE